MCPLPLKEWYSLFLNVVFASFGHLLNRGILVLARPKPVSNGCLSNAERPLFRFMRHYACFVKQLDSIQSSIFHQFLCHRMFFELGHFIPVCSCKLCALKFNLLLFQLSSLSHFPTLELKEAFHKRVDSSSASKLQKSEVNFCRIFYVGLNSNIAKCILGNLFLHCSHDVTVNLPEFLPCNLHISLPKAFLFTCYYCLQITA